MKQAWHVQGVEGEGEDERAVHAAQQEAARGVDRECALLHSRLHLLATYTLVRPHPYCNLCCPHTPLHLTLSLITSLLLNRLWLCHLAQAAHWPSHYMMCCAWLGAAHMLLGCRRFPAVKPKMWSWLAAVLVSQSEVQVML